VKYSVRLKSAINPKFGFHNINSNGINIDNTNTRGTKCLMLKESNLFVKNTVKIFQRPV
jgi:hypothetical protein